MSKKRLHCDQVGFISGMKGWFIFKDPSSVIHFAHSKEGTTLWSSQ